MTQQEKFGVFRTAMTCPLCKGPHTLSQCPRWKVSSQQSLRTRD